MTFLEKLVNEERMSKGASWAVKKGCGERENMTFRFYTLMRCSAERAFVSSFFHGA